MASRNLHVFIGLVIGVLLYHYVYLANEVKFQRCVEDVRRWASAKVHADNG